MKIYNPQIINGAISGSLIGTASYAVSSSFAENGGGGGQGSGLYSIGVTIKSEDTYITEGSKGFRHIPSNSTIVKARGVANVNGNINLNVRKNGNLLGNYNLTNSSSSIDMTLSGWTTSLLENDLIEFYVSQSSLYITQFNFFMDLQG